MLDLFKIIFHIPFEMNPKQTKKKKYCLFRCRPNCLQTELNQANRLGSTSLFVVKKIYVNPNHRIRFQ